MERLTVRRAAAWAAVVALVAGSGTGAATGTVAAAAHPADRSVVSASPASQVLATRHRSRAAVPRTTARWSGSVNTSSWAAVNAAYWRDYASGLDVPTGYTGDDSTCSAGSTSYDSQAATVRAINFVRSLGGLYPVSLNGSLNASSQYTALMMSANRTLSHHPSSTWRCYTSTGATNAARSNLALAYPSITSAGVVGMYMKEQGDSNYAVGHRRWLLNPFTTQMGTGATANANAITVVGPTAASRPNPAWVSWPTPGYFPDALEPNGRWSLSTGNRALNLAGATVRVYRNGVPVSAVKRPVVSGYAMPTLVWELPAGVARTGTFRVVVSGIRKAHSRTSLTRTYSVTMFTPTH